MCWQGCRLDDAPALQFCHSIKWNALSAVVEKAASSVVFALIKYTVRLPEQVEMPDLF